MLGYVTLVNGSVQRLTDSMMQIQDGFAALEQIHDVLAITPNPEDHPDAIEPPISGAVRMRDPSPSRMPTGPCFTVLNQTFEAGKSYAFVGPSGSEQNTLIQLLLRFYDPNDGAIEIDGHDLRTIRQTWYRKHMAVVLQDPILFSGSLEDNIGAGDDSATPAAIREAARKAQAHDFIEQLPHGYATRIGERGVSLSGGQRQRVGHHSARTDARPTHVNSGRGNLGARFGHRTQHSEVVDHLQGTHAVRYCAPPFNRAHVDEILVIDRGHVVERGSYADLLAKGGAFTRLASEQADADSAA